MGRHEDMTEKIKKLIDRWAQEARNPRNDGYSQEGHRGYIEEVRDYASKALDGNKKIEDEKSNRNKWWKPNKPN